MAFRVFILLLLSITLKGAEVFPVSKRGGLPLNLWTNAGPQLGAGIPNRTIIFATKTSSDSLASINSSIASCPSNQIVRLSAGTYNFGGGRLLISVSGVTVRGDTNSSGLPTTFINNADMRIGSDIGPAENWSHVTAINITGGLTEGSTSVTLASSAGADFGVGDVFQIDQTDDGTLVKASSVTFAIRPGRAYQHLLHLTSKSGSTLNFEPPLLGEYWDAATRTPQAVGWSSQVGGTVKMSGFENIDFNGGGNLYPIVLGRAHACWCKNVRVTWSATGGGAAAIRVMFATSCAIHDCIFHDGPSASSSSYALYPSPASYLSVQNNYFTNAGLGIPMISGVGCVIAYNAGLPTYPYSPSAWLPEYFFPHGGHSHHSIYEGNWLGPSIYLDAIFGGNNSSIGMVRNRIQGWSSGKTGNLVPITLETDMDNITILGNVLGVHNIQTSPGQIYGINPSCNGIIKTNNYNVVDQGINSGEALVGNTMLDSYIYTNSLRPEHWGNRPWPPFQSSSGNSTTNTSSYTNIAAGYRAYFGVWPPNNVPTAPQTPLVVSGNASNVFTWTAPADDGGSPVTAYEVYRSTTSGSETFLATTTALGYTNTGLANGTTYFYKVSATNDNGEGALSSEVSGTPFTIPGIPQSLTATPNNTSNVLSWAAPASNGGSTVLGYRVYSSTVSGMETFLTLVTGTGYTNTGLANGTAYYYKVSATNAAGEGSLTSEVSSTPRTVPGVPQSPLVVSGNASNVFTWLAPSDNGGAAVGGYYVYRSTSSGQETFLTSVTVIGYTNTSLVNGTTYFYKVSATNVAGEGTLTSEVNGTPSTIPNAPANLIVTPGYSQLFIQWDAPTDNGGAGVTSYNLYRSTTSGAETLYTNISPSTYTDTAVTANTTYYYKVSGLNIRGEGPLSGESGGAPTGVALNVAASSVMRGTAVLKGTVILR